MKRFKRLLGIVMIISMIGFPVFAQAKKQAVQKFSVGTSTVGGLMYVAGSGWAILMSKHFQGKYEFTPEVTGGHSANLFLLDTGEAEFGTVGAASAEEAYTGRGSWTKGAKLNKSRAMFPISPMSVTAIALAGKGIKTFTDLNGKVVGLGSKGAGVDSQMRAIIEARGIKVKAYHNDGWSATLNALADGHIDAVITMQTSPWPALVELQTTKEIQFIDLTEEDRAVMKRVSPSLSDSVIPAGSYKNMKNDILSVSDWKMMYCSVDVPEEIVYELVKATYERYKDMVALHPALVDVTAKNAISIPVLYHDGAIRYYKEIGLKVAEPIIKPGMK
jgi:hypothetical protein